MNKQIIEIKCTNNEYFERALLFVNSNCELFSENDPQVMAVEYLQKLNDEMDGVEQNDKNPHDKTLRYLLTVLFGAIVTSVLVFVLIAL